MTPMEALVAATGQREGKACEILVGLRALGFVVVPVDVPDEAVGEVMSGTGCHDGVAVRDAVRSALNLVSGIEEPEPSRVASLRLLGRGGGTLREWRVRRLADAATEAAAAHATSRPLAELGDAGG